MEIAPDYTRPLAFAKNVIKVGFSRFFIFLLFPSFCFFFFVLLFERARESYPGRGINCANCHQVRNERVSCGIRFSGSVTVAVQAARNHDRARQYRCIVHLLRFYCYPRERYPRMP